MANTANYNWPLPSPSGIQINEVAKIATSFAAIDAKIKAFETSYSNHKHKFDDLEDKPTTLGGYGITDGMTADQVAQAIKKAVDDLVNGSGTALDTLKELADALGNDPNFATTVGAALGVRVRVDAATSYSLAQRAQGRSNIDALGTVDRGAANGVASLDSGGKVPSAQLPALTTTATVGAAVAGANGKTTPADGDFFAGVEAGGSTMFKTTWGNIKSTLKTYFDPFYLSVAGGILSGTLALRSSLQINEDGNRHLWFRSANGVNTHGLVYSDGVTNDLHLRSYELGTSDDHVSLSVRRDGRVTLPGIVEQATDAATKSYVDNADTARILRDQASHAGFVSGNAAQPYMRHGTSGSGGVVLLARTADLPNVMATVGGMQANGVGSLALLAVPGNPGASWPANTLFGGSDLSMVTGNDLGGPGGNYTSWNPAGTWRYLGPNYSAANSGSRLRGLFVRVS